MRLDAEALRDITRGTELITECDEKISFFRFTPEQAEMYRKYRCEDYCLMTNSTADVRMAFRTDSERVGFDYELSFGSHREPAWFDICVDGALVVHTGSADGKSETGHIDADLGNGTKVVEICFPWSRTVTISGFTLDDGATVVPVRRKYTMISYGDSITHGYDAEYPSLALSSALSRMLGADNTNKAIAGDIFFPELLLPEEPITPDIVTAAYGTNNWNIQDKESFAGDCRRFYSALSEKYRSSRIFAVLPIWRDDNDKRTRFGEPFERTADIIREICAPLDNVTVVGGTRMTPHLDDFYTDGLHPNDKGFCVYAANLYREIATTLRNN